MFGIDFKDHPDLRRILLYDSFVGYPLRKDYPVDRRQPIAAESTPSRPAAVLALTVQDQADSKEHDQTMALPARWANKIEASDPADQIMELQMGPSHPASHGTIKFNLKLDGERIVDCDVEIGYLHRAFEKMTEQGTWTQAIPYTDRLNYASPCINNVAFALAVEKLLGIETPDRCKYVRMIMSEVSRITDHLTCLGMAASEVGAQTVMFYMLEARELLYDLVEAVTGARLTVTWCRIGGITRDLPDDFGERIKFAFKNLEAVMDDCDKLLSRNRVFIDRMSGVGRMSEEDAISYGVTGPLLRATGVAYDVRKADPYLVYDRMDFELPVGEHGRQLRSLQRALPRNFRIQAYHRAGDAADPGRPGQYRRPPLHPAAQRAGL